MAAAESSSTHADDITTCSICLETFTEPKALLCLHTYCLKCLSKYFRDKTQGEEAECPICREVFKIPPGGIKNLRNNFNIQKMIDLQNSNKRIKLSSNYCDQHPGEENVLYCHDCKAVMCTKCVSKHKEHYIEHVSEAAEQFRELLRKDIIELVNKKENNIKLLEPGNKIFIENVELTKKQISDQHKQWISRIKRHQRHLMGLLNKMKAEMLCGLIGKEEDAENQLIFVNFQRDCQVIINKETECNILLKAPDMHARAEELLKTQREPGGLPLSEIEIRFLPTSNVTPKTIDIFVGKFAFYYLNTKLLTMGSVSESCTVSQPIDVCSALNSTTSNGLQSLSIVNTVFNNTAAMPIVSTAAKLADSPAPKSMIGNTPKRAFQNLIVQPTFTLKDTSMRNTRASHTNVTSTHMQNTVGKDIAIHHSKASTSDDCSSTGLLPVPCTLGIPAGSIRLPAAQRSIGLSAGSSIGSEGKCGLGGRSGSGSSESSRHGGSNEEGCSTKGNSTCKGSGCSSKKTGRSKASSYCLGSKTSSGGSNLSSERKRGGGGKRGMRKKDDVRSAEKLRISAASSTSDSDKEASNTACNEDSDNDTDNDNDKDNDNDSVVADSDRQRRLDLISLFS